MYKCGLETINLNSINDYIQIGDDEKCKELLSIHGLE